MKLRGITSVKRLEGKRVLVRIDANVPVEQGRVVDGPHGRIARAAEGIKWLMDRQAKVIVLSHLGRPQNKRDRSARLAPVAARLSELLDAPVLYNGSLLGEGARALLARLRPGGVALLENVRFDPREEKNDLKFAKALAAFADIYVNDAFGVSHRAHASVAAMQTLLPSYAGPLLMDEITRLSAVVTKPKKPFVLLLGGAKMETKIGLLERLGSKVDRMFIGGALATTFLVAQKKHVGASLYEKKELAIALQLIQRFKNKIVLPEDVRVVHSVDRDHKPVVRRVDDLKKTDVIIDVGPWSMRQAIKEIVKAKTVVWNGPVGMCEVPAFCESTILAARAIASLPHATTIVGGGDTVPVVESLHLSERYTLLSTGGGAMLAFLSGEKLPGVEPLIIARRSRM